MVASRTTMVPHHSRVLTGHQHLPMVKDLHHSKPHTARAILHNTSNTTNILHKTNTHPSNRRTVANHHTLPHLTQKIVASHPTLPKVNNKAPTHPAPKAPSAQTARKVSAQL